jgi:hypothetical protein
VDRAALGRHVRPQGGHQRFLQPGRAVDDEQLGRPQPARGQIVEQRPPRRLALAAHVLDRQQHLLAIGADAEDDQEGDAGGLPVEPDADDLPSRISRKIGLAARSRPFQASQSLLTLRQVRLTTSLPTALLKSAIRARRTRRVLVPAR